MRHHQVQYFKDHKHSQLLADGNNPLQCSGSMLTAQGWHKTSTNHRSHDFLWRISVKEKILLLFNPRNLTRSQCKVEQIHTHLACVVIKTFYCPFHNGLPSDGYCPEIREWTKQVRVTNTGTKALPESRTGVCYHHRNTYISYHNGV